MKRFSSGVLMASAFALPPKTIEKSWTLPERTKLFPSALTAQVWQTETLDESPLLSGLLKMDSTRGEVAWVEPLGESIVVLNLATRSKHIKKIQNPDRDLLAFAPQKSGKLKSRRGTWEFLNGTLFFVPRSGDGFPLWNMPIKDELVSMSVDNDRSSWMGLSVYPNRLNHVFWLAGSRRDEAVLEILKWDEDTELVSWVPCSEGKSLLVENVKRTNPLDAAFRVHELEQNDRARTLEWLGTSEITGALATAAATRSCKEVFVTTTKGLLHLKK